MPGRSASPKVEESHAGANKGGDSVEDAPNCSLRVFPDCRLTNDEIENMPTEDRLRYKLWRMKGELVFWQCVAVTCFIIFACQILDSILR